MRNFILPSPTNNPIYVFEVPMQLETSFMVGMRSACDENCLTLFGNNTIYVFQSNFGNFFEQPREND